MHSFKILPQTNMGSPTNSFFLFGSHPKMKEVQALISKIAPTNVPILITGETGTGKELIAQFIHTNSLRNQKKWVAINCGAIPENLLETELFGHEKGAFTGAHQTKFGLVEQAHEGTLFLDEIGELSLKFQAKLLRFLQNGEFYRVGSTELRKVDVRLILATHKNLQAEIKAGKFREDFFFRISSITLELPPLRERKGDLSHLTQLFLQNPVLGRNVNITTVQPEVLRIFEQYPWPGNIRELRNVIQRAKVFCEPPFLKISDLPKNLQELDRNKEQNPPSWIANIFPFISLDEVEKQYILRTLSHFKGNKTKAAQSLGVTLKTLYNKLHRYGLILSEEKT